MIDVEVEDNAWTLALPDAEAVVHTAADAALTGIAPSDVETPVVCVLLTDDATLAALNARFAGKHGPTNVLAFPSPPSAGSHLGDIAIARGVCIREASAQHKPLEHHLMHLTAHGVLHLLGYDHRTDAEAESMEAREREVLEGLGVQDPYEAGPN